MNTKVLLGILNKPWAIEAEAAEHYAHLLHEMIINGAEVTAGLFGSNDQPYLSSENGVPAANGNVLVIPVNGPMMKNDFCGSPGTATMAQYIQSANSNPNIKSIVLSISSPGGSVDGTEHLANTIKSSKKPVVAHGDMMASAAYWIASQAKEVMINGETAMAGSIGTMAVIRDVRGFQEKNGVKEHVIFASRSTDKNRAGLEAMNGNPDRYINEVLDPLNAVFEKAVMQGRSGKVNTEKEDVATGKVYTGKTAIRAGLADKIGNLQTAIRRSVQLANFQTSNKNTMAFENTLATANAEQFEVVDGGFLLTEEQLNSIEATLQQNTEQLATAAAGVQEANDMVAQANAQMEAATAQLAEMREQLGTAQARVTELEALPAAAATQTVKPGADSMGEPKHVSAPINEEARRLKAELYGNN